MKRNVNIELLRIIACMMVVTSHCVSDVSKFPKLGEITIRMFISSPVGLFLMISGYFMFRSKKSYWQKVKGVIWEMYIPMVVVIVLSDILYPWVVENKSILYCVQNMDVNWPQIARDLIRENNTVGLTKHLWYIFAYMRIVVLWMPLLSLLCTEDAKATKIRRGYMIYEFIVILAGNIQYITKPLLNTELEWIPFSPIDSKLLYVLLGYEMYLYFRQEEKRPKARYAVLIYILMCGLLGGSAILCENLKLNRLNYFSVESVFIVISAICIFYTIMSIKIPEMWNGIIYYISDKTYYVYLLHYMISRKITRSATVIEIIGTDNPWFMLLVDLIGTIVISLVCGILIKEVGKRLKAVRRNSESLLKKSSKN